MSYGDRIEMVNYRRIATVVAGCVAGWFVLVYGLAAVLKATGGRPGPGAQSSLEYSSPPARDASGRFLGFGRFDAAELNRIRQGKELRKLRFVGPDVPSTGPAVVSVNVIDDFTWGAAALSDQNDRCYLVVRAIDRDKPQFGGTQHGWLPKGEPCVGAAAVPARVTLPDWPDAGGGGPGVVENLMIGLLIFGPVVAVLAWAVVQITKTEDRGGAALRWLGPMALCVLGWWTAGGAAFGSVDESWSALDAKEVVRSLVWSTIGLAVLGIGAIAFAVSRHRGYQPHNVLAVSSVAAFLAAVPVLFMVAIATII